MSFGSERALTDVERTREAEREQEQAWIERALSGDETAFRGLVERHHRGVTGLVRRLIASSADADDLVQETFARAYCALEQFDTDYRFSTWLYRIALNLCRDHRKSAKRRERAAGLHGDVSEAGADGPALRAQGSHELAPDYRAQLLRLRRAIDRLPPRDREAIVLKDLQELSYAEISQILGAPVTALKIRVLRARARLLSSMQADTGGDDAT